MVQMKNIVASAAITTVALASFGAGNVHATAASCSQDPAAITLTNTETLFVAPVNAEWTGVTQIGPIATTVPAGTYTIDYVSYDDHSHSVNDEGVNTEGQTQEQWFIQGLYEGAVVYTSEGTADVPENVDTITGVFGTDVELPAIDAVMIYHVLTVDESGVFPESVTPSCVSFTPTATPIVCEEGTVLNTETDVCDPVVEEKTEVLAEVDGQGGDTPVVEKAVLADTGVSSVLTMATGVALVGGAGIVSRKQ